MNCICAKCLHFERFFAKFLKSIRERYLRRNLKL